MKRTRVLHNGKAVWGTVAGDLISLADGATMNEQSARFLPPAEPTKIIATSMSYRSRCLEAGMTTLPEEPSYFMIPSTALSHHRAEVARPRGAKFLNYEGEIALIIGKECKDISLEEALNYVSGYTIANDFGLHDFRHADRGSMLRVKGQDGYCPVGPYVVNTSDLTPADMTLRTYVNGKLVQEANVEEDLMFSFAYQVADIARLITLMPGDLLLTGTPANSRPVEVGDVVEVEVTGIGTLTNTIEELDRDLANVGEMPQVTADTLSVALSMPADEAAQRAGDYH